MATRGPGPRRLTISIPLPGPRAAGTLALAIVALTIGAAVLGTAAGAREAAEAAPAPAAVRGAGPGRLVPGVHSIIGRVLGVQDGFLRVRTPSGKPVEVHLLPRTVIRRAGEKVDPSEIQRGDRVLVVGRLTDNGLLQARNVVVRRPALPADGGPAGAPPAAPDASGGDAT